MKIEKPLVTQTYFNGFDYLRIFFALAVVAWHTKALGATGLTGEQFHLNLKDFIYGNIFLLAVPLFIQVSLFLYLVNRKNKPNYFGKRIFELIFLYFFWMALLVLVFYKESALKNLTSLQFWLSGGATPLYFLLVILILTFLTEFFVYLKSVLSRRIFLILTLFFLIVSIAVIVGKTYLFAHLNSSLALFFMSHWSAFNFLPYVFSAIIFADLYEKGVLGKGYVLKWIIISTIFILGLALLEYRYLPSSIYLKYDGMIIPPYSRLSLFLGTWLVFFLALCRNYKLFPVIQKLAGLTLGIYVLHIFVMNILAGLLPDSFANLQNTVFYFLLVTIISGLAASLIKGKRIV